MTARISRVFPFVVILGLATTGLGLGCKAKPSEKACKEAIENIRRISGQDANDVGADPVAAIRSCRGNSSKKAVECMRVAKTLADLEKCEAEAGGLPTGAGDKPVGDKPVEDKPVEDKPVEDKPVEDKPVEDKPAADPVGHAAQATGSAADAPAPAKVEPAKTEPAAP